MSSGPKVDIAYGIKGTQTTLEQETSTNEATNNEITAALSILGPDFYVGPNGKILPNVYKKWIGKNKRDSLMKKVKNPKLKNAVNQLYRPGSIIGDGGTASIIKFEKRTGLGLGKNGGTHIQKGNDMIKYLQNKVLTQPLSHSDRKIANHLLNALKKSIKE